MGSAISAVGKFQSFWTFGEHGPARKKSVSWHNSKCARGSEGWGRSALPKQHVPYRSNPCGATGAGSQEVGFAIYRVNISIFV